MNRTISLLFACFVLWTVPYSVSAQDFILLETLIRAHKKQSDRLKSRHEIGKKIATMSVVEQLITDTYEDKVKKVSRRMGDLLSIAAFAGEVYELEKLTERVIALERKAVNLTLQCADRHPRLVDRGVRVHQQFADMTSAIIGQTAYLVNAGVGVTMATQDQRMQFTGFVREQLLAMRTVLQDFIMFAGGTHAAGTWSSESSFDFWDRYTKGHENILQKAYDFAVDRIKSNTKLKL